MSMNTSFQWKCHPKAELILTNIIEEHCKANPQIAELDQQMHEMTSTRLFDWLDHLSIGYMPQMEAELQELGFTLELATKNYRVLHHPGAQFPRIIAQDAGPSMIGAAISINNIANFLMVRGILGKIEGSPFSTYRRSTISTKNNVSLWVVERRGPFLMEPTHFSDKYIDKYLHAIELWKSRPRSLENEEESMNIAISIAHKIIEMVGQEAAASLVLECEREYWQARNPAGQVQKNRQDALGLGWGNHDHHTFRSSRKLFGKLLQLFETLGFYCRERFYAGKEAGWGAQVMEHCKNRLVLFLDVDLLPEEIEIDFKHESLPPLEKFNTVGLWCALHGDSILKAGMHHLEAQFMFDDLKRDLEKSGIGMMEPFSAFPFLRQAFTKGTMWKVDKTRLQKLLDAKAITPEHAEKFRSQGAVGSHMENLQRREGYKGFNQKNVSSIIQKTDPRTVAF